MTFPKALLPVFLLLVVLVGVLFAIKSTLKPHGDPSSPTVLVASGEVLPDFKVSLFKGESKPISEVIKTTKAKIILINFWAMCCSACVEEMPSIIELAKRYKNDGLEVLAINMDENPDVELPKSQQRFGFPFPLYVDVQQQLSDMFDIHGLPFTMIIDAQRKVLYTETGERDWNDSEVHEQMKKWLGQ